MRNLGRRSALKGNMRRLPEELIVYTMSVGPTGVHIQVYMALKVLTVFKQSSGILAITIR
eukprot:16375501-Heterocapsa_arctica.AAC.1